MIKYFCDWCKKEIPMGFDVKGRSVPVGHKIKMIFHHDDPTDKYWKRQDFICDDCREKFDEFVCGIRFERDN